MLVLVMAGHSLVRLIFPKILWMFLCYLLLPLLLANSKFLLATMLWVPKTPLILFGSDVSITGNDCSSFCVHSIDDESSVVSTVQHANTETGRVNPTLSPDTTAGRVPPSPSTPFSGVGRENASFNLSLHPQLSQAS